MSDSDLDLRSVLDDSDLNGDDPLEDLRRRRKQFWIVVPALLSVIFVVGYLLLYAVVFDLRLDPEDVRENAEIDTSDGIAFVVGNKLILLSNQTNLEVRVKGYETFSSLLRSDSPRRLDIRLLPLPGIVDLIVEAPSQVEIRIDGTLMGVANRLSTELGAGIHEIQLTSPMIQPFSASFEVEGLGEQQEFIFYPDPAQSYLTVRTDPVNATIVLDGQQELARPVEELLIGLGSHELSVTAAGHVPRTIEFSTSFDERLDLGTIKLTANPVVVNVASEPTDAAILLDGKFVASTNGRLLLEPGATHKLSLQKPNFNSITFEVIGAPGEELHRSFRLEEILVAVEITANIKATITHNDKSVGETPLSLKAQDEDRITVSQQGYASQSREIRTANGTAQDFHFTLLTIEQHKYKNAPETIEVTDRLTIKKFPSIRYAMTKGEEAWGTTGSSSSSRESVDVALTRPFYLSTTEVSIKDYEAFKGSGSKSSANDRLPITNVTWLDAVRFCNWLSRRDNLSLVYQFDANGLYRSIDANALGYRLPTELEWLAIYSHDVESQQTINPYPWGTSTAIPRAYGNFAGRESSQKLERFNQQYVDNHDGVAPTASYRPNSNGIFDMAGNVSEWVHDFYALWPSTRELTDYMGPENGLDHVVRGGNYATLDSAKLSSSFRQFVNGKDETVGFRVARWVY